MTMLVYIALLGLAVLKASDINYAITSTKHYDARSTSAPTSALEASFDLTEDVATISGSVTWKDQGWGNYKGHVLLQLVRGGVVKETRSMFGVAGHSTTTRSVSNAVCLFSTHRFRAGDTLRLVMNIGGGGGHQLYIYNFNMDITYGDDDNCPSISPTPSPTYPVDDNACALYGLSLSKKHSCECKAVCDGEFCETNDDVEALLGAANVPDSELCATDAKPECCCSCPNCDGFVAIE
mmetsp:Transcript_44532/g.71313  ORF Transcript_44532/g.71313 Transcript_44532/m.71313 type:complete len:237 (-) Transcript_44532:109-819(-)|eukprot:CAMPEP_0197032024 /NCGR_PEP_ID=MMETSP1384-20130603/10806_1 /TAXON_ID=29189 /ORGANISM="Ammonia sp." /LENGTH=236 /DNA_ID=CAMNT_0042461617 /DNA_START=86 /DNA_END=796 /DNA_ORIENTATION=+